MMPSLRVAVADDEPDMQEYLRETLTSLGYQVVCVVGDGEALSRECRALLPDLVVTDVKMPGQTGLEAAVEICRDRPVPIVVVSAYHVEEALERAAQSSILTFLVKPIRESNLTQAIAIALRRFAEFKAVFAEAGGLRRALEDRNVIEAAKRLLMREAGIDEQTAFQRLQKLASARNHTLVDIAQKIPEAFRGLPES